MTPEQIRHAASILMAAADGEEFVWTVYRKGEVINPVDRYEIEDLLDMKVKPKQEKPMKAWEVMKAFEEGAEIEHRHIDDKEWYVVKKPSWSWHQFDYRVKPNTIMIGTEEVNAPTETGHYTIDVSAIDTFEYETRQQGSHQFRFKNETDRDAVVMAIIKLLRGE